MVRNGLTDCNKVGGHLARYELKHRGTESTEMKTGYTGSRGKIRTDGDVLRIPILLVNLLLPFSVSSVSLWFNLVTAG